MSFISYDVETSPKNILIVFLDIIHRPIFKTYVSETELLLHLQVETTQLGLINKPSLVKVMLRLTVGQSVSIFWCHVHSGTCDQILFSAWNLLCCLCEAPFLTISRVCLLSVSVSSI
jgi:hypothetical protein